MRMIGLLVLKNGFAWKTLEYVLDLSEVNYPVINVGNFSHQNNLYLRNSLFKVIYLFQPIGNMLEFSNNHSLKIKK